MVSIEAQEPWTVALGVLLSFYLDFILVLPYFRFWSVLPKLQASSGSMDEAVRVPQRQQNWCYIAATADIIGAAWQLSLIGEAGERSPHLQAKWGKFVAPIRSFRGFFYVRCASPISGVRIAEQIVLVQHKENERTGKARKTICSALPIVIEIA